MVLCFSLHIRVLGGVGYDHVPCSRPIQTGNQRSITFFQNFLYLTTTDLQTHLNYRFTSPPEQRISLDGVIPLKWGELNLNNPFFSNCHYIFTRHRQYPPPLERAQEAKELWRNSPKLCDHYHVQETNHSCVIMREQCDGSIQVTRLQVCYIYTGLKIFCQMN